MTTDPPAFAKTPVYVFQMGKVGSTAIMHSLLRLGIPAIHCQWLSDHNQEFWRRLGGDDMRETLDHYDRLRAALSDRNHARSVKVVTVVREPLSQILSCYFHNFVHFRGLIEEYYGEVSTETVCAHLKELSFYYLSLKYTHPAALWRQFCQHDNRLDRLGFCWIARNPLRWFDEELWPHFGIDVFAEPFAGETVIDNALILKFESLELRGFPLLADFLGLPEVPMTRANVGVEREGPLYPAVANARPFPREFAEAIHGSVYARHFYDDRARQEAAVRLAS